MKAHAHLLLCASCLLCPSPGTAEDAAEALFSKPVPAVYSKLCQKLDMKIELLDDGRLLIATHVVVEKDATETFQVKSVERPGYTHQHPMNMKHLGRAAPATVALWLQRLARIEKDCAQEITITEEFRVLMRGARKPDAATFKAFIARHGRLPGGSMDLVVAITAADGTAHSFSEGLQKSTYSNSLSR